MITRVSAIQFAPSGGGKARHPKSERSCTGWAMNSLVGALVVKLEVEVGLVKLKPINLKF